MSLNHAITAASSGLQLAARGTKLVADNIANAGTPDYGVRRLDQAARVTGDTGTGVAVTGARRVVDAPLLAELRQASAAAARDDTLLAGLQRVEAALGTPGDAGALSTRIDGLEAALRQAAASPESDAALVAVGGAVDGVADAFAGTQATIQQGRRGADTDIARDVGKLNATLSQIDGLNDRIQQQTIRGAAPLALMDQRQALIGQVAEILPVTEIPRDDGRVMLLAADGEVVLGRDAASFAVTAAGSFGAGDSVASGALDRVTMNGRVIAADGPKLAEGRLGAALALRDTVLPDAQARLDTLAQDLLTRFAGPGVDPTVPAGQPGLFTLSGGPTGPASTTGIAADLQRNPAADPAAGGALWRLRSGLFATAPGPVGDGATLDAARAALARPTPLALGGAAASASGHAGRLASDIATARLAREERATTQAASLSALRESLAAGGVDTDAQMRDLLALEQAYAANARVLSTVDTMMRSLLEI